MAVASMRITASVKVIARTFAALGTAAALIWAVALSLPQPINIEAFEHTGAWASVDNTPIIGKGLVATCKNSGELCRLSYATEHHNAKSVVFEITHKGLDVLSATLSDKELSPIVEQTLAPAIEKKQHSIVFSLAACLQSPCEIIIELSASSANMINLTAQYEPPLAVLPISIGFAAALLWFAIEVAVRYTPFARLRSRWPGPLKALPNLREDLTDQLTSTMNRRGFELHAVESIAKLPGGMALCVIDIDRFKYINDAYGRAAGDELLVAFSQRMQSAIRSSDCLARWGGEEFVVLSQQASEKAAGKFAAKLCAVAAGEPFTVKGSPELQVTVSIGLAQHDPKESFNSWFLRADAALFHAKHSGKNRVCIAPSEREA